MHTRTNLYRLSPALAVFSSFVEVALATAESDIAGKCLVTSKQQQVPEHSDTLLQKHAGLHESISSAHAAQNEIQQISLKSELDVFGENLCADGKLIPELYLLGARKAGTTTLADDLVNTGVLSAAGPKKEFHFFDNRPNESVQETKTAWLDEFPLCPGSNGTTPPPRRMIMADFTPGNLKKVSSPMAGAPEKDLPSMLQSLYGPAMSKQLTFLVMLREPVSRMQSEWYHSNSRHGQPCWRNRCGASFEEDLSTAMREARQTPPKFNDMWWRSLYALQLEEYFSRFLRHQFIMIPYKLYLHRNSSVICDMLSAHLAFPIACPSTLTQKMQHDHPDLAQDVPETLLNDSYDLMAVENRRLARELAVGQPSGAILADFSGSASSESEILSWLQAGW